MKKVFVYPYNQASESAKQLAQSLGCRRIKRQNSRYVPKKDHVVINWGNSGALPFNTDGVHKLLNSPSSVRLASCKLRYLETMNGLYDASQVIPGYTQDSEVAQGWLNGGETVCVRLTTTGTCGEGLEIVEPFTQLSDKQARAPLFTKYFPKKEEYRIHVFNNSVIYCQRKARKLSFPKDQVNWKIRNHDNGFIFAQVEQDQVPYNVLTSALIAISTLELDFGGVDVVYNVKQDKALAIEVNTAPGLEGTTIEKYTEAIRNYVNPPPDPPVRLAVNNDEWDMPAHLDFDEDPN